MKKQLLSIAMLVSMFAVGNVFAGSGQASNSGSEKEPFPTQVNEGKQEGSEPVEPEKVTISKKCGICKRVKEKFMQNWGKAAIVGGVGAAAVAAKLVYDYVNKDENTDEDAENEEI